jgi:transposase
MDIVLAGGRRVIVEPDVERTALPRVIAVQERRWRPVCRRPVRVPGPAGQPDQEPALAKAGVLWHDGVGLSLYAKRLEQGRFIWPSPADEVVAVTAAQLGYLQEGIDWRNPVRTWRPTRAG